MPVILVTNDDGVASEGLRVLENALKDLGDIYVVAPEREQSAVGHALTLHRPLKFERFRKNCYSINGTPTDCVILGVNKLLPRKPDLVVSGINNGGNMGDDITYSGTVAAAMEGTFLGVPSMAVSLVLDYLNEGTGHHKVGGRRAKYPGFKETARFIRKLSGTVLSQGLPQDTFLNVNVPNTSTTRGVKLTRQGKRLYDNSIQEMRDPRGRKHYWIGGGIPLWHSGEDTDIEAVQQGFISVSPIHLDLTNYSALKFMTKKWKL